MLRSIHAARDLGRWIGPQDLARYVSDSLAANYPGSTIRDLGGQDLYEIRLNSEARRGFSEFLERRNLPRGTRLERETGTVVCRFGRAKTTDVRRLTIETIGQSHPFVRCLSAVVGESDAQRLRPAVAARIPASMVNLPLAPARYAVVAVLWRFGGQTEIERIAYSGLDLDTGRFLQDDEAEVLSSSVVGAGHPWLNADADLDLAAVALRIEGTILERLNDRFRREEGGRRAEQNDRALIQARNLERRFDEERGRLADLIDRQRRNALVKGSVIAANEGRLRSLEARTAQRRAVIERSRVITSQQESLFVLVAQVLP
ncbi:MAG: hypothetical protein JW395_3189 [Nitrospira sp.]|nr:hypothetical protein [Nitrospira sp.]